MNVHMVICLMLHKTSLSLRVWFGEHGPTLLSVSGGVFVNLSAAMKIGSDNIGSNSALPNHSGGVFAVAIPDPSSSTTTESTGGYSHNHVGYKSMQVYESNARTQTHKSQSCPLLVTQSETHKYAGGKTKDFISCQ